MRYSTRLKIVREFIREEGHKTSPVVVVDDVAQFTVDGKVRLVCRDYIDSPVEIMYRRGETYDTAKDLEETINAYLPQEDVGLFRLD